jgi:hypothetical protein
MSHYDYLLVMAHYALRDPKKTLENEIAFEETRARILRDRAARDN